MNALQVTTAQTELTDTEVENVLNAHLFREIDIVNAATDRLLIERNRLAEELAVLKQSPNHSGVTEMWLRLLPGTIIGAQKRLDNTQECIDFNIAEVDGYLEILKEKDFA